MWYKQARQFKELKSDHIYWRNKADRLENSIMAGEDIPIEKIMEFKKLTEKTYNNNGWYDSAMLRYNDIKKKWIALQNKKEKEQQQQVESEPELSLDKEIAASLQECTMKINSNTVCLTKESSAFNALEDIIIKIAAVNGIKDVDSVQIQLTADKGIVGFKTAVYDEAQEWAQAQNQKNYEQAAAEAAAEAAKQQPKKDTTTGQPVAPQTGATTTPAQPAQ